MSTALDGLDTQAVEDWLGSRVSTLLHPLTFSLIEGGRSNLTYLIRDAEGQRWVLRRPPLGELLATAHDVVREHGIITKLQSTNVPVPTSPGVCNERGVIGAPFYVMDFVEGHVLRSADDAVVLTEEARRRASASIATTLAAIHAIEPADVGLGQLSRSSGYVERQLKRWYGQWEQTTPCPSRSMDVLFQALRARCPVQTETTIVHGDYRLDNCILDDQGNVTAVLDWELAALGEPCVDLALLLVHWSEAGEAGLLAAAPPTTAYGFLTRSEVVEQYAIASGRDLGDLDYYLAFAYWKVACILQGVSQRFAAGAMGTNPNGAAEEFGEQVSICIAFAEDALKRYRPR